MRRRTRRPEGSHNRERWLISYADFITLLFAFFVVMYSVSSVNEGKYKVLSETLEGIFNAPRATIEPIPVGDDKPSAPLPVEQADPQPAAKDQQAIRQRRAEALREIATRLESEFETLISQGLVTVNGTDEWIELSLRDSLLFSSGEAEPHYDAFPVVESIADILRGHDNAVLVEGFTDNLPIRTNRFPTNWELSAARAAAIVRLLVSEGLDPRNLAAIGYGQYQPVARNDTPEGRSRNRRVILLISRDSTVRGFVR